MISWELLCLLALITLMVAAILLALGYGLPDES